MGSGETSAVRRELDHREQAVLRSLLEYAVSGESPACWQCGARRSPFFDSRDEMGYRATARDLLLRLSTGEIQVGA